MKKLITIMVLMFAATAQVESVGTVTTKGLMFKDTLVVVR